MTYKRLILLDEENSDVVQPLKVIASIGDLERLKAEPVNHIENGIDIDLLLRFGIGVIVPQIAMPTVVTCKAEVDNERFQIFLAPSDAKRWFQREKDVRPMCI